jgi:hypothetical protein
MATVLDTELATYAEHRDELLRAAEGKYVLIRGHEVAGIFDEEMEAVAEGHRRFGMVPILVKEIVRVERPETFASMIIAI